METRRKATNSKNKAWMKS